MASIVLTSGQEGKGKMKKTGKVSGIKTVILLAGASALESIWAGGISFTTSCMTA
jgi:hypothetical protein